MGGVGQPWRRWVAGCFDCDDARARVVARLGGWKGGTGEDEARRALLALLDAWKSLQ